MAALLKGTHGIPVLGRLDGRVRNPSCICLASGSTGAPRDIRVRLPDGTEKTWVLRSDKDLERCFNNRKAGGGVLLETSTRKAITHLMDLQEDALYEVLPPSPTQPGIKSLQGCRLHMPGRYPQQSIEMQYLTQEALWDILVRHGLDGVQPMPHMCKDKGAVYTFIESLTDDTEYVGVPAPPALTLNARAATSEAYMINSGRGHEDAACKALVVLAKEEHVGAPVTAIYHKQYKDPLRRTLVAEVHAACVVALPAKQIAYIAQVTHAADTASLLGAQLKWDMIREHMPSVPALQEDFGGCLDAELFVCADALDEAPSKLREEIKAPDVELLLRSGNHHQLLV